MLSPRVRAAISKADRKAAQILGFTFSRNVRPRNDIHVENDDFVWDVPNPFANARPAEERLRKADPLRHESIGPLQSDVIDGGDDDERDGTTAIALPRLLHTHPICYLGADKTGFEERKAKRDAHRSRLKALAVLGPEAAVAI